MVVGIVAILIIMVTLYLLKNRYETIEPKINQTSSREDIYLEFEKIYKESEDEWKGVVEELKREQIYGQSKNSYEFYFEDNYLVNRDDDSSTIRCYFDGNKLICNDEEKIKNLNMNDALISTLKIMKQKGVISEVFWYPEGTLEIIDFAIDTEYTAFVKDNNGITNYIAYCEDEECEKYGYYQIDENWYAYIPPRPE